MYRKIIFTQLLLIIVFLGDAQQDSLKKTSKKLLYHESKPSYLIPFIETYLKDLTYSNKEQQPVYSEVISLNSLFENREIEEKVVDAFKYSDRHQTELNNSKGRDAYDAEVANNLLNYDKFLVIKCHPFNSLLEFQFLMYDVIQSNDPGIKDVPVLKSHRSSNVFIDPFSVNYKEELAFVLKQVCAEVNERPKAEIKIDNKIFRSLRDTIFLPLKDTIMLAAMAIDPDSPKERFSYTWSVNNENLYSQISYGKEKQFLRIDTSSIIKVGLVIGDGISQSEKKEIILSFIERPTINLLMNGNVFFIGEMNDMMANYMTDIRDDIKNDNYSTCDYLYRKYLFGRRRLLWGEDSLVVFFSNGKLRVANSTASDSILESNYTLNYVAKDSINISNLEEIKKGNYATFHFRPQKKLTSSSYLYTFYAEEEGVKSTNLRLRLNFVKVRQLSLLNEYVYSWMGANKGGAGNLLLGVNWQPFSFMQFSLAGSLLFAPSKNLRNQADAYIQTGIVTPRFSVELFKPNSNAVNRLVICIQQFEIERPDKPRKREYLYGIGWKQVVPFMALGSRTEFFCNYNYFPNFEKKNYISGVGMFEISFGFNYHFLDKKRKSLAGGM